jgi:hypothetical protein
MLQECDVQFEVLQEYSEGARGGRVLLGNVKLNLAEYTHLEDISPSDRDPQDESDDGSITRRYLLQESKINCTLKIGITMKQTEGDTNFISPPLKSAMVVGGIAGVLSTEPGEGEDIPSITSKTRELSEAQDLYRRTLAATWACQTGEMAPDKLIEDLFAGGDGGQMAPPPKSPTKLQPSPRFTDRDESLGSSSSDVESRRTATPRHLTPEMARTGHRRNVSSEASTAHSSHSSTATIRPEREHGHNHEARRRKQEEGWQTELTEFDLREDLRSWQVQVR